MLNINSFQVKLKSNNVASLCSQLAPPNTHANFIDIALPGMVPVLNEECLNLAIMAALAFHGRVNPRIKFDRKHYFYSD